MVGGMKEGRGGGRRFGTEASPDSLVPVNSFSQSLEHAAAAAIAGNVTSVRRRRMWVVGRLSVAKPI
jgi:hypothetical protein